MKFKLLLALITGYSLSWAQTKETVKAYFEQSKQELSTLDLLYKARNYEPLFINNAQLTAVGQDLDSLYSQIQEHGLIAADYKKELWELIKANKAPLNLETELLLSENILLAIEHHLTGRIDPMKVGDDVKFNKKKMGNLVVINQALSENTKNIFHDLAPKTEQYQQLKEILLYLKHLKETYQWKEITPHKEVLKLGSQEEVIVDIKNKLSLLGYKFTSLDNKFDVELEAIVMDIASTKLIKAEKQITPNSYFWTYLNVDINSRLREVELQMEKARWLPDQLEPRHGFVNIANQVITIYDKSLDEQNPIIQFKTINGQVKRKTPSMKDKIVSVILNPTWTVTMNIFFKDKLQLIQKDIGYLQRGRFKVIDLVTDVELDPASIDWNKVTRQNIYFQLVQQPSYSNALGVVKFPMTNKFSIYLHDTNDRNLFSKEYRLLSSGCVRLEKPLDLAEYLLKSTPWSKEKILQTIAKPGENKDTDTRIYLKNSLPMYLMNLTVEKKNNIIKFYDDYYGQNTDLYKALAKLGHFKK